MKWTKGTFTVTHIATKVLMETYPPSILCKHTYKGQILFKRKAPKAK